MNFFLLSAKPYFLRSSKVKPINSVYFLLPQTGKVLPCLSTLTTTTIEPIESMISFKEIDFIPESNSYNARNAPKNYTVTQKVLPKKKKHRKK